MLYFSIIVNDISKMCILLKLRILNPTFVATVTSFDLSSAFQTLNGNICDGENQELSSVSKFK